MKGYGDGNGGRKRGRVALFLDTLTFVVALILLTGAVAFFSKGFTV